MYVHSNNFPKFLEAGIYKATVEEVFVDEDYYGNQTVTVKFSIPKDGIDYMLRCVFKSNGVERWQQLASHLEALGIDMEHIADYKGKQVQVTFRNINENGRMFQNVTKLEP